MTDTPETGARLGFEEDASPRGGDAATGPDVIRAYLPRLPTRPGVYRMLGRKGEVLYVGKARSLRARVTNYARLQGNSARIQRMILATASMMFVTTPTETEALLLEANLIKQLKPRYNVILRDDKSFAHILITGDHDFPRIVKHRGAKTQPGRYFGPFASAGAVNWTLNQVQKAFLLRTCSDSVFESRTRPCLLHQIKRCSAPCVGLISKKDYAALVADAVRFLEGKSTTVQQGLAEQMRAAAAEMEFEQAAVYRDRIAALTRVQQAQGINPATVEEADVVAVHADGGQACVQVFFFRSHQNWGNRAYFPRTGSDAPEEEILAAFLAQFYGGKTPARLVLTSCEPEDRDLVEEALSLAAGRKVTLARPQRGEKRMLVEHALTNAREALARRMAESAAQTRLLAGVAEAFGLEAPPRRIEVYDNSHIQGAHAVGAMIVAGPDGFERKAYRKFNIKDASLTPGDDFGMMKEVLTRRFQRLLREDPDRETPEWPDLILIDGGAGQVSAVKSIMEELGVADVAMIGVAKGVDRDAGKEEFHRPEGGRPFALPHRDPTLYFIQRLRDEAHRFVIGAHRAKRKKSMSRSPLDDAPGVGPARKRALLAHFGSAKAVARAGLADLMSVEGISEKMAQSLHDFFNDDG
ncbi:excinuclease ABC subunit UvrC [Pikeienuella sp. HZG-20]|uniref:excinuclease ABC subunit UvrC n=1 Tax=Paludibacillus litoralis TaxID=3133267 RepID=UPI0030EC44B2